ncbi:hypothetical protein E4T56_gene19842 [Termitomyces sp. T112]|nr:hypothetical protein E4T56_gene19842 [Termitomyces sp. T112]
MLYVGRIHLGILRVGDVLWGLDAEGQKVGEGKVKKIFARNAAGAGEIVSVAGVKNAGVNITLVQMEGWGEEGPKPLPDDVKLCSRQGGLMWWDADKDSCTGEENGQDSFELEDDSESGEDNRTGNEYQLEEE